jgi:hypothetical protein
MGFAGRESAPVTLLNRTTDAPIATRVELAVTRRARRRGLLGRARLAPGAALVLVPCVAVHTAFMRFPIDVVFVNRQGMAIRAVARLRPWRVAMAAGAYAVIELAAGSLARRDLKVGDRVCLVRTDRPGATQACELAQVDEWLNARAS